MPPAIDVLSALGWSARICGLGLVFQSLELLSLSPELRDRHLLGWQGDGRGPGFLRRVLQHGQCFPVTVLVLLGRTIVAAAITLAPGGATTGWLLGLLLLAQFHFLLRFRLVLTNADHVNLVVLSAATIGLHPGASPTLRIVALGFMAVEALLAYAASGIVKLGVAGWRDGTRLTQVFLNSAHRCPPFGRLFAARPGLARGVSWGVAVGEALFPLGLLLPAKGFLAVAVAGLAFHAAIAVGMGLPGFFWAFAATYPALYYMNVYMTSTLRL